MTTYNPPNVMLPIFDPLNFSNSTSGAIVINWAFILDGNNIWTGTNVFDGDTIFNAPVVMNSTLQVLGQTLLANVTASGTTNLAATNITGLLALTGNETISGNLSVNGTTSNKADTRFIDPNIPSDFTQFYQTAIEMAIVNQSPVGIVTVSCKNSLGANTQCILISAAGVTIPVGLTVTGGLTTDTLNVTGAVVFSSVSITGNLSVAGTTTLAVTNINGLATINNNLQVNGNESVTGTIGTTTLNVNGVASVGTLNVVTALNSNGTNTFANDIYINTITVGNGAGHLKENSVLGLAALPANITGVNNVAVGGYALQNETATTYTTTVSTLILAQSPQYSLGNTPPSTNPVYLPLIATGSGSGFSCNIKISFVNIASQWIGQANSFDFIYNFTSGGSWTATPTITVDYSSLTGYPYFYVQVVGVINPTMSAPAPVNLGGNNNTAVGWYGLGLQNNGSNNSSLGFNSGSNITYGNQNTCIGYNSQVPNPAGNNQLVLGTVAETIYMQGGVLGTPSIGAWFPKDISICGTDQSTGLKVGCGGGAIPSNTVVGLNSFGQNTAGIENTVVGHTTLNNSHGNYNTAIGNGAGNGLVTGGANTFLGANAGSNADGGYNNTFVGVNCLAPVVGGSNQLVLGTVAETLYVPSVASQFTNDITINGGTTVGNGGGHIVTNSVLGQGALSINSSGYQNTALGYNAGSNITTGHNNTCIGANTQILNPTGYNQISIGTASDITTFIGEVDMQAPVVFGKYAGSASTSTQWSIQYIAGVSTLLTPTFNTNNLSFSIGSQQIVGYLDFVNVYITAENGVYLGSDTTVTQISGQKNISIAQINQADYVGGVYTLPALLSQVYFFNSTVGTSGYGYRMELPAPSLEYSGCQVVFRRGATNNSYQNYNITIVGGLPLLFAPQGGGVGTEIVLWAAWNYGSGGMFPNVTMVCDGVYWYGYGC